MQIKQPYLNILVNLIINSYFNDSWCIIHYHEEDMDLVDVQNVPTASFRVSDANVTLFDVDPMQQCKHFLLQFFEARWAFETAEFSIADKNMNWYSSRKYLIIIFHADELEQFFNSVILRFVPDILIIYAPTELYYNLYTHNYVGLDKCNDVVHLDSWYTGNMTFKLGNSLYPDKVTDQQGRELRTVCSEDIPYASCKSEPPVGNEYNIVVKYAERFNMTLNTNYTMNEYCLEYDDENDENNCDLLFGGFPFYEENDLVMSSRYTYVVVVPLPRIKYGWFMFLAVFDLYVWLLILVLYVFARGAVYLYNIIYIKSQCSYSNTRANISSLTMYGLFINQPATESSDTYKRTFLKYIIMLMLVACVLLVTAYNSRLASIMVSPIYENDINTLDELAKSNLKLLFFSQYFYFFEDDERITYRTLYEKVIDMFNYSDVWFPEAFLSSREYAVALHRHNNGDYTKEGDLLTHMHGKFKPIMPELFTDSIYFWLKISSVHTPQLQRLVRTAEETGLMAFWVDSALQTDDEIIYQRGMLEPVHADETIPLNPGHLKGIFVFWAFGLAISFVAFITEVVKGTKN